ncbi:MAG TPA: DUF1565 domain-containing protein [Fimbriimonadaceae bacterium]|nr:DUF1565 domain-containing protein [Fimbriimonadaceae bacterium]
MNLKGIGVLGGVVLAASGWAATIHVSPTGSNAQSGASWGQAKLTIAAALAIAQPGDQVFVRTGTYFERVTLPNGVALYGGFAGTESNPGQRAIASNPTVMDGQSGGRVIRIAGAVVTSNTVVDGLTIQNGSADRGAGIFFETGNPQIRFSSFLNNAATLQGGGLGFDSGSPSVAGNLFQGNTVTTMGLTSTAMGGGIGANDLMSASIEKNHFINNTVTMIGDFSEGLGGGIGFYDGSPTIRWNLFQGNRIESFSDTGQASGAGVYFYGLPGSPQILANQFLDNSCFAMGIGATAGGASVYGYTGSSTIASNLMARSTCTYEGFFSGPDGGAISLYEGSHAVISNTITGTLAEDQGAIAIWTGDAVVFNNILSGNTSGLFTGCAGNADYNLYHNNGAFDTSGTLGLGTNCVQNDPNFVDPFLSDFRLQQSSAARDTGDDSVIVAGWTDADVLSRIFGGRTDRGAFEFRFTPVPVTGQVTLQSFLGDVTNEPVTIEFRVAGVVHDAAVVTLDANGQFSTTTNVRGLYTVTAKGTHWLRQKIDGLNVGNSGVSGLSYSLTNGDIDGNNTVDSDDFDLLVANFGGSGPVGDLDGNGTVDSDDFDILVAAFGMTGDN